MRLIDADALKTYILINNIGCGCSEDYQKSFLNAVEDQPTVEPFHNTTMSEVLRYIDDISEDEWQEFTACLECRGWYLERKTSKWCGGDFA